MSRGASNIIKASSVSPQVGRPVQTRATLQPGAQAHNANDAVTIELHKNGDVIEAIEVTCGCGRTTFIECLYEDQETTS